MRLWTIHLANGASRPPRLVREGFSWGAFLLGPFWLLFAGAWIPALLLAAVDVLIDATLPMAASRAIGLGLSLLAGLYARDLVRWSLERRGYVLANVVAAPAEAGAWFRLLESRPDLRAAEAGRLAA